MRDITLTIANAETTLIKRNISEGLDPQIERQKALLPKIHTVDDLAFDWLKDCDKRLKHPNIPRRAYQKDIAPEIGFYPIDQVMPTEIRSIINKVTKSGRPTVANDTLLYRKQLFRHVIKLNLLRYNPAEPFGVSDAGGRAI